MTNYDLLVYTASLYIGVKETSENRGDMVEKFQAVTKTIGQPWCVSFIQHCVRSLDAFQMSLDKNISKTSQIPLSASVINLYNLCPSGMIKDTPRPGYIALWRFYKEDMPTSAGHCGIVHSVASGQFLSIEGNTEDSTDIVREGDGVFLRTRTLVGSKKMRIIGFLDPWFHLPEEEKWIRS